MDRNKLGNWMLGLSAIAAFCVFCFVSDENYQEVMKEEQASTPKYDPRPQVINACEKYLAGG